MEKLILIIIALSTFLFSTTSQAGLETHIRVYTENAVTLQQEINGKVEGPAADMVNAVLDEAGVTYDTHVTLWARALKFTQQDKNALIYSILRTRERENKYVWLGKIAQPRYYYLAKKSLAVDINAPGFNKRPIATLRGSASVQGIQAAGFKHLTQVASPEQVFGMLDRGRVDVITVNKSSLPAMCQKYNLNCDDYETLAPLDVGENKLEQLYFAMNRNADPNLVSNIKQAYDRLIKQGEIAVF